MASPDDFDDFLPAARREFRAFYSTATAGDAVLMDVLLQTHAALILAIKAPRHPENPLGDVLERVTDAT